MNWLPVITALLPLLAKCREARGEAATRATILSGDARAQRAVARATRREAIRQQGRPYWRQHRDDLLAAAALQLNDLTEIEVDDLLAEAGGDNDDDPGETPEE